MIFKKIYTKIWLTILLFVICNNFLHSQNTPINSQYYSNTFNKALELYNNQMYNPAYNEFNKILNKANAHNSKHINNSLIEGYKLLCKIHLNHPNIKGEFSKYEKLYQNSPIINNIYFNYATYNLNNNDFIEANKYYNKIDTKSISKNDIPELWFKRGYCLLNNNMLNDAKLMFSKLSGGKYYYPAQYYLGYINYLEKNFNTAIQHFSNSINDQRFKDLSKIHILESKFMLKDYSYVLNNGEQLYNSLNNNYKQTIARILSESYYATNNIDKANYFYELYSVNSNNINRNDYYYSGMIAYNLKNYKDAINSFSNVINETDSLQQSAYYHIGECYIDLKNKHKAQEAFYKASETDFDNQIKEDAFFNYAKLTFDLTRNIEPFENYLSQFYISDKKWDEIHNYMATAFINNKNYDNAIKVLNEIKNPDKSSINTISKVYFIRGLELISHNSYRNAIDYLNKSLSINKYNSNLNNLTKYWLAECKYRIQDYNSAINLLNSLENTPSFKNTNEYPSIFYNKGYNYFKMGDYTQAIENFNKYINSYYPHKEYKNEAQTRLADSYFMSKNYNKAAELFEQISKEEKNKSLYSPIQAAISYGLTSNDTKKIEILESITTPANKKLPFYTKALYELSRSYTQNIKDKEAEITLNKLINNPPDSLYYYKALLELGMIKANAKQNKEALGYYEQIVSKNPISEEAQSALSGIENIYISENKSAEFLEYLDNVGLSKTKTASEKENMLFNSAEQLFLEGNYTSALQALNSFVKNYPNGENKNQALFYIAESYNKLDKKENACEAYYNVMMSEEDGAFREIATLNYGRLNYQLQQFDEAIKAYETLTKIAKLENNKNEGFMGKMESYYMLEDYDSAISSSNEVLNIEKLDNNRKRKANYIKAKSLQIKGERDLSLNILKDLSKYKQDTYGAEATYMLIQDAYDSGDFKAVEDLTFKFSDSKTPQSYWLAMSFIVLGDSYAERDNFNQAKATFESISDNYTNKNDDILDQVKLRLKKLTELENNNN